MSIYNPNAPYRPMTDSEQEESYAYRAIKQVSRPYKVAFVATTFPTRAEKEAFTKKHPNLKSGETVIAGNNAKNDPNTPFFGIFSKNPKSNCQNCVAYDWGCEADKAVCELTNNDYWPFILGGLGVILVVVLAR